MSSQRAGTDSNESVPYRIARRARDPRLLPLRESIVDALCKTENAVVIDVGSGGGLLAAWAAECASVRLVYALEDDPLLAQYTRTALSRHAHRQRVEVVETDNLLTYQPPEPWDVMLCDVVSTGLLRQPQAPLINHFLRFAAGAPTVIPQAVITSATLLDVDLTRLAGRLTVGCPFEDPQGLSRKYAITRPADLGTVFFDRPVQPGFSASVEVQIRFDGWARAVLLETRFVACGSALANPSPYDPVVVPLTTPVSVKESELINVKLDFGYRQADADNRASAGPLPAQLDGSIVRVSK